MLEFLWSVFGKIFLFSLHTMLAKKAWTRGSRAYGAFSFYLESPTGHQKRPTVLCIVDHKKICHFGLIERFCYITLCLGVMSRLLEKFIEEVVIFLDTEAEFVWMKQGVYLQVIGPKIILLDLSKYMKLHITQTASKWKFCAFFFLPFFFCFFSIFFGFFFVRLLIFCFERLYRNFLFFFLPRLSSIFDEIFKLAKVETELFWHRDTSNFVCFRQGNFFLDVDVAQKVLCGPGKIY